MTELQTAILTCPRCSARSLSMMPEDYCLVRYDCPACGAALAPKPGDCCVFCSYADRPCPPKVAAGCC